MWGVKQIRTKNLRDRAIEREKGFISKTQEFGRRRKKEEVDEKQEYTSKGQPISIKLNTKKDTKQMFIQSLRRVKKKMDKTVEINVGWVELQRQIEISVTI